MVARFRSRGPGQPDTGGVGRFTVHPRTRALAEKRALPAERGSAPSGCQPPVVTVRSVENAPQVPSGSRGLIRTAYVLPASVPRLTVCRARPPGASSLPAKVVTNTSSR